MSECTQLGTIREIRLLRLITKPDATKHFHQTIIR
jgi:hypothetical protein